MIRFCIFTSFCIGRAIILLITFGGRGRRVGFLRAIGRSRDGERRDDFFALSKRRNGLDHKIQEDMEHLGHVFYLLAFVSGIFDLCHHFIKGIWS